MRNLLITLLILAAIATAIFIVWQFWPVSKEIPRYPIYTEEIVSENDLIVPPEKPAEQGKDKG